MKKNILAYVSVCAYMAYALVFPFASITQAAGIETAFTYDSSSDALKVMTEAADDGKEGGFASSSFLARGGPFGEGSTFKFLRHVDNYGYQYGFNYYCVGGKTQTDPPPADKESYKIEITAMMDLRKDFNKAQKYDYNKSGNDAKNSYDGKLTHVTRTSAKLPNEPASTKESGYSKGMGIFPADDPNKTTVAAESNKDKIDLETSCLTPLYELQKAAVSAVNLESAQTAQDVKDSWKPTKEKGDATAAALADGTKESPDCEATGSPLSWIICPVVDGVTGAIDFMYTKLMQPLLENSPISTEENNGSFLAWKQFRLLGNIVLVGALLAVVYSQAKGGGK